jgi:ABC-2 type transport system ATP-binding protein
MVGDLAHAADIAIHELRAEKTHLEELYFNLTDSDQHRNRNLGEAAAPLGQLPPPSGPPIDPRLLAVTPDAAPPDPREPETHGQEESR